MGTAQVKKWRKKLSYSNELSWFFLTNAHIFILTEMHFSGMPPNHEEIYRVPIYNLVEFFSIDYAALDIYVTTDLCLRN